ncbi:flagellar biosynthesis anti-sigma factor FlgM [Salirhabdus sp. Marseille-P4669]|uniref:flagellar biosynthesis anti-sigma factor FlgM n=1 Tax=Salirhabdus sp. Marseille-P4669 TaxID=2042310 RepID=UPI000C7B12F0|nr:flagellar biosynthesis anti-sigma factor FlgM [Salirhabdus sp. Marseille-P4669]
MKIQGSNFNNINPYQKQIQKQAAIQQGNRTDKVEISSKAQELLKGNPVEEARKTRVEQLKQDVQSGNYKVNYEETAKKMIAFYTGK